MPSRSFSLALARPAQPVLAFALLLAATPLAPCPLPAQGATPTAGSLAAPPPFAVARHGQGRPMILIPGLLSSGDVWNGAVAHFQDRYAMHVLTLAGFAGVPSIDAPNFLDAERDAIIQYIREQRLDRPVLVGHSLGGFLALAVAAAAPELVGPVVAVDGVPFLPALGDSAATPGAMRQQAEGLQRMYATLSTEQLGMQTGMAFMSMAHDTTHLAVVTAWARSSDPATAGRAVAGLMTTDLRDAVAAIRAPVLLVAAASHATTPEARERVRRIYAAQVARIPAHEVVVAPDARHFIMYDAPEFLFSTMDRFLAERAPVR